MCTMIPGLDLIAFDCPDCRLEIRVPAAFAGRRGECPECEVEIRIPDAPSPSTCRDNPLLLDDDEDDWGLDSDTGELPIDAHALIPRGKPSQGYSGSSRSSNSSAQAAAILETLPEGPVIAPATPWPKAAVAAVAVLTTLVVAAVTLGTLAIVA
jgi:hypothetical protein